MVYLAAARRSGFTPVRQIAEALGISAPFLSKVFQQLVQAGLAESYRGPSGGVRVAQPPETIMLLRIVVAIDGEGLFRDCVLGLPGCGHARPCPVHDAWVARRADLQQMFAARTLAEAAASVHDDARRLAADTSGDA